MHSFMVIIPEAASVSAVRRRGCVGARTSTAVRINCTPYSRRPSSHFGANGSPDKASGRELLAAPSCRPHWMATSGDLLDALQAPHHHGLVSSAVPARRPRERRRLPIARDAVTRHKCRDFWLRAACSDMKSTPSLSGVSHRRYRLVGLAKGS